MLAIVRQDVGPRAQVEFERELCTRLHCPRCVATRDFFRSLGKVTVAAATCPECGEVCDPLLTHKLDGSEDYLDRTLAELGLPPYDIVTGREGLTMRHYLLRADRELALGSIA